jgi:hypothetical protein
MDIVERLRDWGKFGVSRGDFVAYSHEAADEIEQLRNAIKVQANAVRILHEAEMSELNLLRKNAQQAYIAKATLDSEREANKILTDEIERLREENNDLKSALRNVLFSEVSHVKITEFTKEKE